MSWISCAISSARAIGVAAPVAKKNSMLLNLLQAPEGPRVAVLFPFAEGQSLRPSGQTPELSALYGQSIARLHAASDDFFSVHPRFQLDLAFLLETPLKAIQPLLTHRPADWSYVQHLAEVLQDLLKALPMESLDRGPCHGDAQGGNAVLGGDGSLTFFDFDVCGMSWRAYDLAVYFWGMAMGKSRAGWDDRKVEQLWQAYLTGYQAVHPLAELDLRVIPVMALLRHFWFLGLETANWDIWGCQTADEAFWAGELVFLRELAERAELR